MSADNFYYVCGRHVWMGFASDYDAFLYEEKNRLLEEHMAGVEERWFQRMRHEEPIYVAQTTDEAVDWATSEYAEYGVWRVEK